LGIASFGWPFLILGTFLILGAILQPHAPTSGKWLVWVGALLLSLVVIPFGSATVFQEVKLLRLYHDGMMVAILSLSAMSTFLLLWCDVALLIEGLKVRHNKWTRGSLDWVVWIASITLSAWCLWIIPGTAYAYRVNGRVDSLLTTTGLGALILFFDLALIVHAVKTRRAD
jgi:hypothetical protein